MILFIYFFFPVASFHSWQLKAEMLRVAPVRESKCSCSPGTAAHPAPSPPHTGCGCAEPCGLLVLRLSRSRLCLGSVLSSSAKRVLPGKASVSSSLGMAMSFQAVAPQPPRQAPGANVCSFYLQLVGSWGTTEPGSPRAEGS